MSERVHLTHWLWFGAYVRKTTATHVYVRWFWGLYANVTPRRLRRRSRTRTSRGAGSHTTTFHGLNDLRDLFSGRITAEEYSKRAPPFFTESRPYEFPTAPEVITRRLEMAERIAKRHARKNEDLDT